MIKVFITTAQNGFPLTAADAPLLIARTEHEITYIDLELGVDGVYRDLPPIAIKSKRKSGFYDLSGVILKS